MEYCQETVIIQSAFVLAGKMINIEENKHEFGEVIKIITEAINEVSEGLSINDIPVLPIQTNALHRKLHLWLYKTWQKCCSASSSIAVYLEGFPPLPRFGTIFYVTIVKEMCWESLFVECLFHTHEEVLPIVLQDILSILTHQLCSEKDSGLITMSFGCLLTLVSKSNRWSSLVQILSDSLTSVLEHIVDENLQVHLIKTIIDLVLQRCFVEVRHSNIWSNNLQLKQENDLGTSEECIPDPVSKSDVNSITEDNYAGDSRLTDKHSQIIYSLEVLMKLFTELWKDTCKWSIKVGDNVAHLGCVLWHPLHQWILKMYAVLGFIISDTTSNTSQDSRMCLFYNKLTPYVETVATTTESKWIHNLQKGLIADWSGFNELGDEPIDISGTSKILMFTNGSLKQKFHDALWRVDHNLEGSVDCLNWLLTTEEVFDNPLWIKCIKGNVLKIGYKEQAVMMVDILCVQRQIIESVPECDSNLFDIIKVLIIDLFNDLPMMDQEEIVEYGFRMLLLSALDITHDSAFFNPNHQENDKKALQDELQVLFNKLVDSSVVVAFQRQVRNIKNMALLSPYITLYKVLESGVQYGQTHTIIKILEGLPILCSLCTSDTATPILNEMLASIATGLRNKQEENNFIKLVNRLLQGYSNVGSPGTRPPLLDTSNLVSTCILPNMKLHGNGNLIPTKFALKLLKSTMTAFDTNNQSAKTFVLKYLIPLILALCRLLDACKVHWEERGYNLPLADVAELRNLILINLEVSIHVICNTFQNGPNILVHSVEWFSHKLKALDWTTALHVKALLDLLPVKHRYYVPKCVIECCALPTEHWTPQEDTHDYNVVDGLFACCAVSDTMSCQVIDALKNSPPIDVRLKDHVIRNLCQVMAYFTWSEMNRILSLCKILIQNGQIPSEWFSDHSKSTMLPFVGLPATLSGILGMSGILRQVFQLLLLSPNTSFSKVILGNVIKLYVSTIKEMCRELVTDPGLDKNVSGDVISCLFDDLSHVMCIVPVEDTDSLFILALDVASMVSGRHAMNIKQSVAIVPRSVYTESLLKKLDMRILAP